MRPYIQNILCFFGWHMWLPWIHVSESFNSKKCANCSKRQIEQLKDPSEKEKELIKEFKELQKLIKGIKCPKS